MFKALLRLWKEHLLNHALLYLGAIILLMAGIAIGSVVVQLIEKHELADLAHYFNAFMITYPIKDINSLLIAQKAIIGNIKFMLMIWFLGLTIIGIPAILLIVFIRGLILGFSVGFLVMQKGIIGIILSLLAVLPQNLFFIPAFIVASVAAIVFSLSLLKGTAGRYGRTLSQSFFNYFILFVFLFSLNIFGSMVEGYFSPFVIKLIAAYL